MRKAHARPKTKELRKLYKGLLTTSIVARVEVLKTALQWFDQALEYVQARTKKDELKAEVIRSVDRALKARRLGISSEKQPEKETAFRTAIKIYELLCKTLRPYSVEKAYAEQEKYAKRIERRRHHLANRYGVLLFLLQTALCPVSSSGVDMTLVVDDIDKERAFSRSGDEFVYSRKAAKECRDTLRRRGLLPLVLQELKPLSRAAAMEDDGQGHFKVNSEKQVEAMLSLLANFIKFCQQPDAPRRLIKVPSDGQPRAARKGGGRFGKPKEKIDGLYVAGSAAGLLYERLKDGAWHELPELSKGIAANVHGRLSMLARHGRTRGWRIEWRKTYQPNQVRLVKEAIEK